MGSLEKILKTSLYMAHGRCPWDESQYRLDPPHLQAIDPPHLEVLEHLHLEVCHYLKRLIALGFRCRQIVDRPVPQRSPEKVTASRNVCLPLQKTAARSS